MLLKERQFFDKDVIAQLYFYPDTSIPITAGSKKRNPDYAVTLRNIAQNGIGDFRRTEMIPSPLFQVLPDDLDLLIGRGVKLKILARVFEFLNQLWKRLFLGEIELALHAATSLIWVCVNLAASSGVAFFTANPGTHHPVFSLSPAFRTASNFSLPPSWPPASVRNLRALLKRLISTLSSA
jgi:hypothetical protein